jgi:hypothetical protein
VNPIRLNNQLLDAIDKNIRLLLPTKSMTDRRGTSISDSSRSTTSTTSYDQNINSTDRTGSIYSSSKRGYDETFSGGMDGDHGNDTPDEKQLPQKPGNPPRVRRQVHEHLNKEFSGGTVDEVVKTLSKLFPQARVCEDITESSVRRNLKFSKDGKDSSIVLTLGVFPSLPVQRVQGVRFQHTDETLKRGFSLTCIDPRLARYAVINCTVDSVRTKYTVAMQGMGMRFEKMTNAAPPKFHHVNTDTSHSAAEVQCFAEWFCKNQQFDRDEFASRVQLVRKQGVGPKKTKKAVSKEKKEKTVDSGHDVLKSCNLDDSSSDEFSAGQTE